MMTHILHFSQDEWRLLQEHLLQNHTEQAAMVFASVEETAAGLRFRASEIELLASGDFTHQSSLHIALTDEARGRVIKRAWDLQLAIIELHSHVGRFASAAFSASDHAGLTEFVPHVRWRLRGAPYAAVVVTSKAFDALVWAGQNNRLPTQANICVGEITLSPSSARASTWGSYK